MGLLTILKKVKEEEHEIRILVLGLDNAGKTTIVKRLCGQPINEIEPTLGFTIHTLDYNTNTNANSANKNSTEEDQIDDTDENYKLHLWDIGGQSTIRAYWRNYFEKTDGIIWVVDSNDRQRLKLVRSELSLVLKQERLAGSSLLIMANKNDLQGSLTEEEVGGRNGLRIKEELLKGQTNTRHWKIQGCSAVTKTGLSEGIDWLVNDITDRIFFTG